MKKLVVALLCFVLSACGEREISLGNGYLYVQLDGRNYAISDLRHAMVVDPNVVRYRLIGAYIVGERDVPTIIDDPRFSRKFGFFILDAQTGQLVEGLNENEFETALRSRGLDLHPFSWFTWVKQQV